MGKKRSRQPAASTPQPPQRVDDLDPERLPPCLVEESAFATLFPRYLETALQDCWPRVKEALSKHHITAELDMREGSMTVRTTRATRDPFAIIKARDMMRLLGRSVPLEHAKRVLADDCWCDVIKIGNLLRNKEKFVRRRQRLVGPEGKTLKGNTVSCLGPLEGCRAVRRVVEECFANIHPIYNLKRLLVMRELQKNPVMRNRDWSRFIPQFRRVHEKQEAVKKRRRRVNDSKKRGAKPRATFPPPQLLRKEDLQMESGEAFMTGTYGQRKHQRHQEEVAEKRQATKADRAEADAEKRRGRPPKRAKTEQ